MTHTPVGGTLLKACVGLYVLPILVRVPLRTVAQSVLSRVDLLAKLGFSPLRPCRCLRILDFE
jgi:hypothetical protein